MTRRSTSPRIQGFVVRGYRLPVAGYLFLRIDDVGARRGAGSPSITDDVLTAAPWSQKPDVGRQHRASPTPACARSACPTPALAGFPEEFRQGMAARAALLGDTGESAPASWEAAFGTADVHVLVMISALDREALRRTRPAAARGDRSDAAG